MLEHFKQLYNISESQIEILYNIIGDHPGKLGYYVSLLRDGIDFSDVLELAMKMEARDRRKDDLKL